MSTQLLLWLDVVGSVIVIAGALWGTVRWGRAAVRALKAWVERVGDNTDATRTLTGVVSDVRDDIREVVATLREHDARLGDHEARITRMEEGGAVWGNWYWPLGLSVMAAWFVPAELFALLTDPASTLSDYCWRELHISRAVELSAHGAAWWASLVSWLVFVVIITGHIWWRGV